MRCLADLHIHSCLSPCADDDMTPWNIAGMARIKGLDAIAVCDHNSARNLPAAMKAGAEYGVCVVPGIEATTREDVHLLCYFAELSDALALGEILREHQSVIRNKPALFGNQILVDEDDTPIGEEERLLIAASDISLSELTALVWERGGAAVPAHINKGANSLLPVLGMLPLDVELPTVEIFRTRPHSVLGRLCIHSSDAHQLVDIAEAEQACILELNEITPRAIVELFRRGEGAGKDSP